MFRRKCGCRNRYKPIGTILISLGIGIFLAYIIPYNLLITMLGIGLVVLGIWYLAGR